MMILSSNSPEATVTERIFPQLIFSFLSPEKRKPLASALHFFKTPKKSGEAKKRKEKIEEEETTKEREGERREREFL